jgi:hypothetical protein
MVSPDWPAQHTDECFVGWPRRFYPARNLGRRTNWLEPDERASPSPYKSAILCRTSHRPWIS